MRLFEPAIQHKVGVIAGRFVGLTDNPVLLYPVAFVVLKFILRIDFSIIEIVEV